jgi:hypothetical protein
LDVSDAETPREPEFNQETSRLTDGLRSCRTVLESYRELLGADRGGEAVEAPPPLNDNQE